MYPSKQIIDTWNKCSQFPMETLTKAWFYNKNTKKKQRDITLMREHHQQYGITGNCFDLVIWLLDECKKDGIEAYPIGQHLHTKSAHVAVIMLDENGNRYLCDLGDQWIYPVLIDAQNDYFTNEKISGFFPGANIQINPQNHDFEVLYHRPNGKISKQVYNGTPIDLSTLLHAAEFSQNEIKPRPLLECKTVYKNEMAHWEFLDWESFLSTSEGLFYDQKLETIQEWADRIHSKTRYDKQFLLEALTIYKNMVNSKGTIV